MTSSRTVQTRDGASIAVRLDGPDGAPTLTFTHSLATSSNMWEPQVRALKDRFRIVRIDFRGHGGSSVHPPPDGFTRLAEDVLTVWDALGIARSHYVGLSLGGIVAAPLSLDHADRLDRVIIADCRFDATPPYLATWAQRTELLEKGGMQAIADVTLPTWLTAEHMAADPTLVAELRSGVEATNPEGWRSIVAMFPSLDYKWRLGEITTEPLYLSGAKDAVAAEMKACADLTPNAHFAMIEDANHLANLDQPDAFNARIAEFLG